MFYRLVGLPGSHKPYKNIPFTRSIVIIYMIIHITHVP